MYPRCAMGRFTKDLQTFWSVDTLEQAMHERVTVPRQPEAWADDAQAAVARHLFADSEVQGKDILDFGCGVGRVAKQLARRGAVVHAVDVSPRMVEYCREFCRGAGEVRCYLCDGYTVPLPDRSMDGGYSFYVFQHMPDEEMIRSVLNDIHRVLKPGGWFKLQSVDHRCQTAPDQVGMHGVRQAPAALGGMAEQAGLKVVAVSEERQADVDCYFLSLTAR
jgi:SAM-dependent methyltransferase